jgi:hypothetical protein
MNSKISVQGAMLVGTNGTTTLRKIPTPMCRNLTPLPLGVEKIHAWPKPNGLPTSTYLQKRIICPLTLGVEKIHACLNHCMLNPK